MPIPQTVQGFREQFPEQLASYSDQQIAAAVHKKYYSSVPQEYFYTRFLPEQPEEPTITPEPAASEPGWFGALGGAVKSGVRGLKASLLQTQADFARTDPEFLQRAERVAAEGGDVQAWLDKQSEDALIQEYGGPSVSSLMLERMNERQRSKEDLGTRNQNALASIRQGVESTQQRQERADVATEEYEAGIPEFVKEDRWRPKSLAYQVTESVTRMTPGLLASVITRSPGPMMATVGVDVYGAQLKESMDRGMTRNQARSRAAIGALAEGATEMIPAKAILGLGRQAWDRGVRSIIKAAALEGGQEVTVELINKVTDAAYNKALDMPGQFDDMTLGQIVAQTANDLAYAGVVGAGAGGALRTGAMAADKVTQPMTRRLRGGAMAPEAAPDTAPEPPLGGESQSDAVDDALRAFEAEVREDMAARAPEMDDITSMEPGPERDAKLREFFEKSTREAEEMGRKAAEGPATETVDTEPARPADPDVADMARPGFELGTPAPSMVTGESDVLETSRGDEFGFQWAVLSADDLVASSNTDGFTNPEYPQALQPRDRSTPESVDQMRRIRAKVTPRKLGDTGMAESGAIVIRPDGVILSGNGRGAGIKASYEDNKTIDEYRQWVKTRAPQYGISEADIAAAGDKPVLVRVLDDSDSSRVMNFVRDANNPEVLRMGPAEQARVDSNVITPELMQQYSPDESGNPGAASNDAFMRQFSAALGASASGMRSADGTWSRQMIDRVKSAVFHVAYADDRLINAVAEDAGPDRKNVLAALQMAAPAFARARAVDPELGGVDVAEAITGGVEIVTEAADKGIKVEEFVSQGDLIGGTAVSNPDAVAIAKFIDANRRSGKKMGEAFKQMGGFLEQRLRDQMNASMFGDDKPLSVATLIEDVTNIQVEQEGAPTAEPKPGGMLDLGDTTPQKESQRTGATVPMPSDGLFGQQAAPEQPAKPDNVVDLRKPAADTLAERGLEEGQAVRKPGRKEGQWIEGTVKVSAQGVPFVSVDGKRVALDEAWMNSPPALPWDTFEEPAGAKYELATLNDKGELDPDAKWAAILGGGDTAVGVSTKGIVKRTSPDGTVEYNAGMGYFPTLEATLENRAQTVAEVARVSAERKDANEAAIEKIIAEQEAEKPAPELALEAPPAKPEKPKAAEAQAERVEDEATLGVDEVEIEAEGGTEAPAVRPSLRLPEGEAIDPVELQSTVQPIAERLDGIDVQIVDTVPEGLPETTEAYTDGQTAYLVGGRIRNPKHAGIVLAHEVIGHVGMNRVVGDGWGALEKQYRTMKVNNRSSEFRAVLKEVQERYGEDINEADELREFVAVLAERRHTSGAMGRLYRRVVSAVRAGLKRLGFNQSFSMTDMHDMLGRAGEAVERPAAESAEVEATLETETAEPVEEAVEAAPVGAEAAPAEAVETETEAAPADVEGTETVPTEEQEQLRASARPESEPLTDWQRKADKAQIERLRKAENDWKDKIRKQYRKWMYSSGNLTQQQYLWKQERDANLSATEFYEIGKIGALFKKNMASAYGVKSYHDLTAEQKKQANDALTGAVDIETLPKQAQVGISALRTKIDMLSRNIVAMEKSQLERMKADKRDPEAIAEKEAFIERIEGNIGFYLHRSYRAHDDPKWPDKVSAEVKQRAQDAIAKDLLENEGGITTEAEAQERAGQKVNDILQMGTAADTAAGRAIVSEGMLGRKDMGIFKQRKDIPVEIRELLGEYTDPLINYGKSVTKMATMLANQTFLEKVRADGEGTYFWKAGDQPVDGQPVVQLPDSPAYGPLAGMYTYREMRDAFEDANQTEMLPRWLRYLQGVNAWTKVGKTVGSPLTQMRNFASAAGFVVRSGLWSSFAKGDGFKIVSATFKDIGSMESAKFKRRLVELGVNMDSAAAGEMQALFRDARIVEFFEEMFGKGGAAGVKSFDKIRKPFQFMMRAYTFGDDFWKTVGFAAERGRLEKYFPDKSAEWLDKEAANRIRDTFPTYSKAPAVIQRVLRRFPFTSPFVVFTSEAIRTGYWKPLQLVKQDWKDPKTRPLAASRLAGMVISEAMFFAAAGVTAKLIAGLDDEDEEALRRFLPPWQENSQLVYFEPPENGKIRFWDSTYHNAYGYVPRIVTALNRDQPIEDRLKGGAAEMVKPFFGWEIMPKAVVDVLNNKSATGRQIFNPAESNAQQAKDIAGYLAKTAAPGVFNLGMETYKAARGRRRWNEQLYDPTAAAAAWAGFRITEIDFRDGLLFKGREFTQAKLDSQRSVVDALNAPQGDPKGSDTQIRKAFDQSKAAWVQSWDNMRLNVRSAQRLGMSRAKVIQALTAAGVSQQDVGFLISNRVAPMYLTESRLETRIERDVYREKDAAGRAETLERINLILELSREFHQELAADWAGAG